MHLPPLSAETLAPIRARFLLALRDREARVAQAALSASTTQAALLLDDAHKIRGVAPMLGMAQLGALAADAEDRLDAWLAAIPPAPHATPQPMPDDLHQCLCALHRAIRAALG